MENTEKERNKKKSFRWVSTQLGKENSKKIAKKFEKLKKNSMASFQARIGCERPRKKENKKIIPIGSHQTRNRKFQKNSKN